MIFLKKKSFLIVFKFLKFNDQNLLYMAVLSKNEKAVRFLLANPKIDVNIKGIWTKYIWITFKRIIFNHISNQFFLILFWDLDF